MSAVAEHTEYYRRFILGKEKLTPADFGIDIPKDDLADMLIEELNVRFRGARTVDELLLHPREAIRFCEDMCLKNHWLDVPDQFILRTMLNRRKHPV